MAPGRPGEVLDLPEEHRLVRFLLPDDGRRPPPAFARSDGGADDARVLLTGPADALDDLAAALRPEAGR